jgi:hypothetical protein
MNQDMSGDGRADDADGAGVDAALLYLRQARSNAQRVAVLTVEFDAAAAAMDSELRALRLQLGAGTGGDVTPSTRGR